MDGSQRGRPARRAFISYTRKAFWGESHLRRIQKEAQELIAQNLCQRGVRRQHRRVTGCAMPDRYFEIGSDRNPGRLEHGQENEVITPVVALRFSVLPWASAHLRRQTANLKFAGITLKRAPHAIYDQAGYRAAADATLTPAELLSRDNTDPAPGALYGDLLSQRPSAAGVRNLVLLDHQIPGCSRDVKAVSIAGIAVVHHRIVPEHVPVAAILERLFTEVDAVRPVARHRIVEELVVRIFVPYRDAVASVIFGIKLFSKRPCAAHASRGTNRYRRCYAYGNPPLAAVDCRCPDEPRIRRDHRIQS